MKTIVLVPVYEMERGWGKKLDDHMACLNNQLADEFIVEFNARNNEVKVPDWYMYASDEKTPIDITDDQYKKLESIGRLWWSAFKNDGKKK